LFGFVTLFERRFGVVEDRNFGLAMDRRIESRSD
jgi:hypothetical protein